MLVMALASALSVRFVMSTDFFHTKITSLLWDRDYKSLKNDSFHRENSDLFFDSILSIVQFYYVDPNRVTDRELAISAIGAVSRHKDVSFKYTSKGVVLRVKENDYSLDLPLKSNYEESLAFYKKIEEISVKHHLFSTDLQNPNSPNTETRLIDAVLRTLDAHSSLLSADAYRELKQGTEGSFGGLGVLVGIRDQILTVLKPIPGSPAEKAGIRKNDVILDINGVHTFGKSLENLVEYMRGEPGSEVHLSLLRFGAKEPSKLNIKREIVQVDSVLAQEVPMKGTKILYIAIENFAARTSREVRSALLKFKKATRGPIPGVILDLRGNPGGLLDQAVQVADIFLPSGVIVSTKGRREEIESAVNDQDETGYPMVVLIDEDSASASEIVAGALQDQGRAVVIGQPSYGKGSVQTVFELPNERALKLTIARYYTPNGRSIQNTGIFPDIWLQPVIMLEKNENLLGDQRYRSERFLRNHLESYGSPSTSSGRTTLHKAYYLKKIAANDIAIEKRGTSDDEEFSLAKKIIQKVYATYGSKLPDGSGRASHWLGLAGPSITSITRDLNSRLEAWLWQKHGISWIASKTPINKPKLELKLSEDTPSEAMLGAPLKLHWSLKNNEQQSLHRISLFLRSDSPDFETKEILIGTIKNQQILEGDILLTMPTKLPDENPTLNLGLALESQPVSHIHIEHPIQINPRPLALLEANMSMIDAHSGYSKSTLENMEKARLKIHLENKGLETASDLRMQVFNLSGSQFSINNISPTTFDILPQKSVDIWVDVAASNHLKSDELDIGIFVEGKNLEEPLRKRSSIKSRSHKKISGEKSSIVGH